MQTFTSYHKDETVFCHQTQIFFSQCNKSKVLSLHELLRLTSDCAVEDYRTRGLSREFLLEHNFAILVSRVAFKFFRLPSENERITLVTWEEKAEALQLMRSYQIFAEDQTLLVTGLSSWLLVDPVERKILPTKKFTLRPSPTLLLQKDCPRPAKISLKEDMQPLGERLISYSDLDANGHTNNARYGAFVEDNLPPQYAEKTPLEFRINFSKEAMLGQKLHLFGDFSQNRACIAGKTQDGKPSFESELIFGEEK